METLGTPLYARNSQIVSEELNSVETALIHVLPVWEYRVSEELNSVETKHGEVILTHTKGFQKNLIVWKQTPQHPEYKTSTNVSEELNSVETNMHLKHSIEISQFQKNLIVWKHNIFAPPQLG